MNEYKSKCATFGWWREAKLCLAGGNSDNGANCGLVSVNSNNAFSNSNTNRGSRNDISNRSLVERASQTMTSPESGAVPKGMSENRIAERSQLANNETSSVSRLILESSGRIKCKA